MRISIEEIPSKEITASAWGRLRSYLAIQKYSQEWIKEVLGDDRRGQRCIDIVNKLREAL